MSFPLGVIAGFPFSPAVEPPPDGELEPVSAPYWRLRMPWSHSNLGAYYIEEVEMRAVEGGADQCTGGTATASSGSTPGSAFDDSSASAWSSSTGDNSFNGWLQYQFPTPVQVTEIAVRSHTNAEYTPRMIALQYSQDGTTWTEWAHWAGLTWEVRETKVLNAANRRIIPAGTSPFWRINVSANNWRGGVTNYLEINELEFRASPGGPSLPPTMAGKHVSSVLGGASSWSGGQYAFDGLYNNDSAITSAQDRLPAWLGYLFAEPVSVVEAAIRADTSETYCPRDFTFEYSNDLGLTWTVVHAASDYVVWHDFEVKTIDLTQPTSRGVRGDWYLDPTRVANGWALSNLGSAAENVSGGDNDAGFVVSTKPLGTIPRYFEVRIDARGAAANTGYVGIVAEGERAFYQAAQMADRPNSFGYRENGEVRRSTGIIYTGVSYGAGDIVMVSYNRNLNALRFGKNGSWHPETVTVPVGHAHSAAFGLRDQGDVATLIGNPADFTYSPPPGYSDLAA
jgi:hypothetical protein